MHAEPNRLKEEYVSALREAMHPKTAFQIAREAGIKALVWSPFIAGIAFGVAAFATKRMRPV